MHHSHEIALAEISLRDFRRLLPAERSLALAPLREIVIAHTGLRVSGGPFAGAKISQHSTGSELLPKLLGTYELELHGVIEEFIAANYNALINVGCSEGFYAVGFAVRWKERAATVLAFDSNPAALEITREVAADNGVAG